MKITIPLGTYGLELATLVRDKFNEQRNKHPERSALRNNAYISFRGRGYRHKTVSFRQELPAKYAQYVSLYLYVDITKYIKAKIEKLFYIKHWYTEQTGGNCMVDMLVRNDGKVIGVTDECVALYESVEDFWNQEKQPKEIWVHEGSA